jgi:hypothetical protein
MVQEPQFQSSFKSFEPGVQVRDRIDRFINELVAFTKLYDDFLGLCIYIFHQRSLLALFAIAVLINTNAANPEIVGFNMSSQKWKSFLDALGDLQEGIAHHQALVSG